MDFFFQIPAIFAENFYKINGFFIKKSRPEKERQNQQKAIINLMKTF